MIQFNTNIFPVSKGAYLVGGSVRNLLLGRVPADYDIVVLENPEEYAHRLAGNTNGHLVKIGKPGQMIFRVITDDNIFDISPAKGISINEDLFERDFTINAMAYSLSSRKIIDCMGSRLDLFAKRVRMVSKDAFRKDPIRLMRAYRIGAFLDFEIEPQTVSVIKDEAMLIQNSAGERIREELLKIFRTSKSHYYLSNMAETGLLFAVFPELEKLKGCFQNRYHQYNAYDHTIKAFFHLETILNNYSELMPEICSQISLYIDKNKVPLLKCAMLLHDIAKPFVKTVERSANVHFYGHAKKGADMSKKITRRLKFSNREMSYIEFIVRNHMRPLFLFQAHQKKTLTRKGYTRFFIKCGDTTPALLLHSMADIKGKRDDGSHKAFMILAKNMLHDFFSTFKPSKSKPPLITGHDLINELGLRPSPLFKVILGRIEEARLLKKIESRTAALQFARNFLDDKD